jgi:hypothetical protein
MITSSHYLSCNPPLCALLPHLQAGMSASEPNSPRVPVPDVSLSVQTSPHARAKRKIAALMDEIEILKQDKATKQRYEARTHQLSD